jgi:hypothetical protein
VKFVGLNLLLLSTIGREKRRMTWRRRKERKNIICGVEICLFFTLPWQ